jgi:hypothetical protein
MDSLTGEVEGRDEESYSGLIEAALEISRKEVKKLEELRAALEKQDLEKVLELTRELVGLETTAQEGHSNEKGTRTDQSIHGGAGWQ